MKAVLGEYTYVCGSPLVPEKHALEGVIYTRGGLDCRTAMETQVGFGQGNGRSKATISGAL